MKVEIIKCLKDNFSYLLINEKNKNACVIDPSESKPIIDFVEKPTIPPSTLAATAYWLLSEEGVSNFFEYINSGGDRDALGNFLVWNVRRNDVRCVSFRGNWYDIGDLESYKAAQKWLTN